MTPKAPARPRPSRNTGGVRTTLKRRQFLMTSAATRAAASIAAPAIGADPILIGVP